MNIRKIILLSGCLLLFVLAAGCQRSGDKGDSRPEEASTSFEDVNPENLDDIMMENVVNDVMEDMTLEEKIGQLFIVCTDSLDFNAETECTDVMKENLLKYHPGGIIFFSFNLKDREQIQKYISDIQQCTRIPLFISVDEEGGSVARIANTDGMGTTSFPSMSEIGKTRDTAKAREVGETIGKDISALGFNLDFAPVADITTNEANTEIGERSFGSDASLVSDMVSEVVKGLQDNGVSATLKHFPGQGDRAEDTHRGYVDLDVTIDGLRKTEFLPFKKGIKAGADFVMMSHVSVKNVTQSEEPASLSSLMVTDILRNELKYDNIIITDAMNMKVITKFYDADQAAIKALKAGNDMILMPDDFVSAYESILEAVNDGTLSEEELDEAVFRIIRVKIRRGILPLNSALINQKSE